MNDDEKKAVSTSLPELFNRIEVSTSFQRAIVRHRLIPVCFVDKLFKHPSGEEVVFRLFQRFKKASDFKAFSNLLEALMEAGERRAVSVLIRHRDLHRGERLSTNAGFFARENGVVASVPVATPANLADTTFGPRTQAFLSLRMDTRDVNRLRETLRKTNPKRDSETGDVAVTDDYCEEVCHFVGRNPADFPPGALQEPDLTQRRLEDLNFLPPSCCAQLSRYCGGRSTLFLHAVKGFKVLRTIDYEVKYCRASIFLQPGKIHIRRVLWLSVAHTLEESLSDLTSWYTFRAKVYDSDEDLDLSMTGDQWLKHKCTKRISILLPESSTRELSLEDRRRMVSRDLRSPEVVEDLDVLVTARYSGRVRAFASGKTDQEPGRVEVPRPGQLSYHRDNLAFLPPECCATLIRLYGGQVSLLRTNERGPLNLLGMDLHTKYFFCNLLVRKESVVEDCDYGSYVFSEGATLAKAISSAIPWVPTKAQTKGTSVNLDLSMTVRDWFLNSSKCSIVLWNS